MSIEYSQLSEPLADAREQDQPPVQKESRVRIIVAGILVAIGVGCLVARLFYPFGFTGDESHGWFLDRLIPRLQKFVGGWDLPMMIFYPFALLVIFILEELHPAVPTQKTLSDGLVHDAFWVIIRATLGAIVISEYGRLIYNLYTTYLGFLTIPVANSMPAALRWVIAFLVLDLTQWFQHWLHHNVKWLWPFHAVHHAQRELNVFSDYRVHSVEYLVRRPIALLPMLMLGLETPSVAWWLLINSWHTRLYHANIKSNFGWLRYIIVTPQSHRVHHSIHDEHINHNYGSMLSIWDYLFNTQYRKYDLYPETGISDEHFPYESSQSVGNVLATVARQFFYPFRQLWGMVRGS